MEIAGKRDVLEKNGKRGKGREGRRDARTELIRGGRGTSGETWLIVELVSRDRWWNSGMNRHGYLGGKEGRGVPLDGEERRWRAARRRAEGCHKFKQQLTLGVGLFPQACILYLYRGERPKVQSRGECSSVKKMRAHASSWARLVRGERNGAIGRKAKGRKKEGRYIVRRLQVKLFSQRRPWFINHRRSRRLPILLSSFHLPLHFSPRKSSLRFLSPLLQPRQRTDQKHRQQITRALFNSSFLLSSFEDEKVSVNKGRGISLGWFERFLSIFFARIGRISWADETLLSIIESTRWRDELRIKFGNGRDIPSPIPNWVGKRDETVSSSLMRTSIRFHD